MEFTSPDTQFRLLADAMYTCEERALDGFYERTSGIQKKPHRLRNPLRLPVQLFAPRVDDTLFGCAAVILMAAPVLVFAATTWWP